MTKDEFRAFCHEVFTSRGFRKNKKNKYYLNGQNRILCCIELQKSMSEGYYLNYHYYIGLFEKIKDYPSTYSPDYDLYSRVIVPQKDPGMAKSCPTTALIEYQYYSEEYLYPILNEWLDKLILPVQQGKDFLVDHIDEYVDDEFDRERFLERAKEKS